MQLAALRGPGCRAGRRASHDHHRPGDPRCRPARIRGSGESLEFGHFGVRRPALASFLGYRVTK